MQMPWGKHRGLALEQLPLDYLLWLLRLEDLHERWPDLHAALGREHERRRAQRSQAGHEAGRRFSGPAIEDVKDIVDTGYRALALKHHPDRGGDVSRMQRINLAAEWLRTTMRRLVHR
jgi:hypothetical protein